MLADRHIYLAGPPDTVDAADPLAAWENRKGGLLAVFSKADGKKLAQHKLDAAPVYDGLAAARGRLFLALKDGTVVCLSGR